mgnify:CR=1 FL=1
MTVGITAPELRMVLHSEDINSTVKWANKFQLLTVYLEKDRDLAIKKPTELTSYLEYLELEYL